MDSLSALFGDSFLSTAGTLGGQAFGWLGERDRARYQAQVGQAWASAYAAAAPGVAAAQGAAAVAQSQGRDKLFLAGFAILAVVVLFRIRPTANG